MQHHHTLKEDASLAPCCTADFSRDMHVEHMLDTILQLAADKREHKLNQSHHVDAAAGVFGWLVGWWGVGCRLEPNAYRNEVHTMQARIQAMKDQNWIESDEFVKVGVCVCGGSSRVWV